VEILSLIVMGLRDILNKYKLLTDETAERIDLLMSALRRKPGYSDALKRYGAQSGGADSGDFIGPQISSFIDATKSNPELFRTMLAGLFSAVYILDSAEQLPGFGSILGASLDIMLMGGKVLTKSIQAGLPVVVGLLPIPYASMAGLGMAAVFGMIAWPMIALVSLSRQDFATATDAYIRAIPPPFGDMLANVFTEGNRAAGKINARREQLGEDLAAAFKMISEALSGPEVQNAQQGFNNLATRVRESAQSSAPYKTISQSMSGPAAQRAREGLTSLGERVRQSAQLPSPAFRGGFHGRTKKRTWRRRRTQRTFARH